MDHIQLWYTQQPGWIQLLCWIGVFCAICVIGVGVMFGINFLVPVPAEDDEDEIDPVPEPPDDNQSID